MKGMKVMGQVPTRNDAVVLTVLHALTATHAECMTRGDIRDVLKRIDRPLSKADTKEALAFLVQERYTKTKRRKGQPRVYACKHSPKKCDQFRDMVDSVLEPDEIVYLIGSLLPTPPMMVIDISTLFGGGAGYDPFS